MGIPAEVEGRMNAKQYVSILEDNLLSSMKAYGFSKKDIIIYYDNDSKYSSKRA